jgi:hypothetical protein
MKSCQAFAICQFDACQRPGKERMISDSSDPNQQTIIRPVVCHEHFRRMMEVDGPEWRWLKTLPWT